MNSWGCVNDLWQGIRLQSWMQATSFAHLDLPGHATDVMRMAKE